MRVSQINISVIAVMVVVYILFMFRVNPNDYLIYLTNLMAGVVFFFTLNIILKHGEKDYTSSRLIILVFFYALFFVFIYNLLSFIYRDNFWVFAEKDPLFYHNEAIKFNSESFFKSLNYYFRFEEYEDLGGVLVVSTLYNIAETNLVLNLFYIGAAVISAKSIFDISQNFMSKKYSFLCAFTYTCSSYALWFDSTGLKESFLIMLILIFYKYYFKLKFHFSFNNLIVALLFLSTLMFFRPLLIIFCLISIGLGIFFSKKLNIFSIIIIVAFFLAIVVSFSFVFNRVSLMLAGGDVNSFIETKEEIGTLKGSLQFTYAVNLLSSFAGPFPTINPSKNDLASLSICSSGLMFRVYLSLAFIFGLYYIFKCRIKTIYPIVFFALIEMLSLVLIMESINLRKNLPHFPMIYMISFLFLDRFNKPGFFEKKTVLGLNKIFKFSLVPLTIFVIYWNYR